MLKVELTDSRENTDKLLSNIVSWKYFLIKNAAISAAFYVGTFIFLFGFLFFLSGCTQAPKLQEGLIAPDIEFVTATGQKTTLSSHVKQSDSNQNTLLVFWSTWCDVCKHELPELDKLASTNQLKVIAIAIRDQKDRWTQYTTDHKFENLTMGFADTKSVLDKYKGDGVPESFLLDNNFKFLSVVDVKGQKVVRMIGPQPWQQPLFFTQLFKQS